MVSFRKYADICPLLDVEDMVMFEKPDWKCVFTYVQTFYRRFRNGRDPPAPTKKLTLTPPIPAPTINLAKSIEVSIEQPYYFPAPEITEEKKLSLMQKYLDLEDEKPKKKAVKKPVPAPRKPAPATKPVKVSFAPVKVKKQRLHKSKSLDHLHAQNTSSSLKTKSNSLPTVIPQHDHHHPGAKEMSKNS